MTQIAKRRMTHSQSFDGVDDYVDLGTDFTTDAVSFSGWIFPKSYGEDGSFGYGRIFDNGKLLIYLNEDNDGTYGTIRVSSDGASTTINSADYSVLLNKWTHISATRNADGEWNIYVNGSLSGDADQSGGTITAATTNAFIGNSSATSRTFDGLISDFRIHTKELTNEEAENLYQYALTHSPAHEYFNSIETDGAGTVLTDSVGSNDGTISGATWSTEVPIRDSVVIDNVNTHALRFDTSAIVECGTIDITEYTSITFEAKCSRVGTGVQRILSIHHSGSDDIRMLSASDGSGKWEFATDDGTTVVAKAGNPYILNVKDHVVGTYDGTTAKIYVNGVLSGTATGTFDFSTADGSIAIGGISGSAAFGGEMDFARIYSTALTPQQAYDLHFNKVVPRENLVAEYLLNEGTGTTATDSAGNNDGTISGATWTPASEGKVAVPSEMPHVLRFDGNDYAQATAIAMNASMAYTFDLMPLPTNTNHYFISNQVDGNAGFGFKIEGDILKFRYEYGNTGIGVDVAKTYFEYNKKQKITVNVVSSVLSIYIDGVLVTSTSDTAGFASDAGKFNIGAGAASGSNLIGTISNVIVHNTSLTTPEVYNLHHHNIIPTTGLVGNWDRISDDGTTLIDSVNGNDGTISGATRVTTLAGIPEPQKAIVPWVGSVEFDASGDNVDLGADFITAPFTYRGKYFIRDTGAGFVLVDSLSGGEGFRIESNSNRRLRVYNATANSSTSNYAYEYNKWFDLCVVLESDGSTNVYVDSILIKQFSLGMYVAGTTNLLHIGNRLDLARGDWGRCAGARIYNKALTTAEVEQLYITNTTPYDNNKDICVLNLSAETGLLSGSTWKDASGNNNDGTIIGATLSAERPHGNRKVNDGNLLAPFFDKRPYFEAFQTTNLRWLDGTATGSNSSGIFLLYGGNSGSFEWGYDPAEDNALKLSITGTGSYIQVRTNATTYDTDQNEGYPMKPNTQYKLSFKMKTNYVSGDASSGAYFTTLEAKADGTNNGGSGGITPIKTTTDWTEYEVIWTTHVDTVRAHNELRIYGHQGTGTLIMDAWFKDIKLIEV